MRRIVLAMLVLGAAGFAASADDVDPEPRFGGSGKLAGDWEMLEVKAKGVAVPLPDGAKATFVLKKNGTLTVSVQGQQKDGKWKLNAKKNPKELDVTFDGKTLKVIYKLDKEEATLGISEQPDAGRPKDFASAHATMVLKRKK